MRKHNSDENQSADDKPAVPPQPNPPVDVEGGDGTHPRDQIDPATWKNLMDESED